MLQWDYVFLLETCQCITNNKKLITTFTFTFLVTHFNFTQLLFWILALLDLSFLLLLSDCSIYFGSPLCLFICSLNLCAPATYITAFQVLLSNTYDSGRCLFITISVLWLPVYILCSYMSLNIMV